MKCQLLVLLFAATCLASKVRFDNFEVYHVTPWTLRQLDGIRELQKYSHGYNFWTGANKIGQAVDIMVPPHLKNDFLDFVQLLRLDNKLWIPNVQKLIDNEKTSVGTRGVFNWKTYQDLEGIHQWLRSLADEFPGIVTVVEGGHSYEGRSILGVHVSFKSGNKGVFLEGGIHAREWIGPATVTYILNELLRSTDPIVRDVAESRDWYVFPSVNPDGYVYTHTTNRMWRKTRKPYGFCYGADPNRNWGYHWMDGGASKNPCSDTYAGSSAFSEIETKTLSSYISTIASNLDIYLGFHSYSQLLLIPYGHNGHEVPHNNKELLTVGKNAANKLSHRYGTRYTVGNVFDAIYVASGGSFDWVLSNFKDIRFSYTFELRDTGRHGFLLPAEQIIPTAQETLDSVVSMVRQADGKE